jgi:hypothetical protein
MRSNITEDKIFVQLKEAWIASSGEIDEAASEADKNVFFNQENIVDKKGDGIKVRALVKDESDQDAFIDLIIPSKYIRDEGDKQRISSQYITKAKSNFNKGLYATGGIDLSKNYEKDEANLPKNKLSKIVLVKADTTLPRYSKSGKQTLDVKDQLVSTGVKLRPDDINKKSIVTSGNGKAVIVNVNNEPHFLVGFEMLDTDPNTQRINDEGDAVIVATMPVPLSKVGADGIINPEYINEFIAKWNSGKRYEWDGHKGRVTQVENPQGSQLSFDELAGKLVDLDRFKPEFDGTIGTQGADVQRHRTQDLAQKKLITDSDIEAEEKKRGKPFTRSEFIAFVKGKGLVPPDVFKKDEFGNKLFRRWKQNNPRIAKYIKSRKRALGQFAADPSRYETPDQARDRMAQAHDQEEIVIQDLDFSDVPEGEFAVAD